MRVYYTYETTTMDWSAFWAAYGVILLISGLIGIFLIVCRWKMYTKAGKPGWAALIPFYNEWVFFEMGGQKGPYVFFMLIPCAGPIIYLVFYIKALIEVCKRFGKDTTFAVLSIFFEFVTFPILAFSDAKYTQPAEEKKTSILDVDLNGVPDSDDRTFDYGYEKQDTVVMNPVDKEQDESTEEEKK